MSKREIAARVLGNPALSRVRDSAGALRILAYHRIVSGPWDEFAFDEQLISATPEAFEAQMRFAKRNFEVLSFADLAECDRAGRPWPKRALIVTFDDGYRDNLTEAFPILRTLGLPATIFLATGHIGEAHLFWWDTIAYGFKRTGLHEVTLPQIRPEPFLLRSKTERRASIDAVLAWAKTNPEAQRHQFVAELPGLLEIEMPSDVAKGMHLNWDEVRQMAAGGIEFGSHTVTHPILSRVDAAQLRIETCESKATIERELGTSPLAFAYPAGTRGRRDDTTLQAVKAAGYHFAVVYDEGVETQPDRHVMPRIHVDRDHSRALFRANLLFPSFMLRS